MNLIARARGEHWRAALSVLANRNFVPLWFSGGMVSLGGATLNIALMKWIYDQTGSASGVGLLVFTNIFSMYLFNNFSKWLMRAGPSRCNTLN